MAKKQLTPEQYKAKLEKKVEKRKKFTNLFIRTVAICVAIAVVYSTATMAYTKIGLASMVQNSTANVSATTSEGSDDSNVDWDSSTDSSTSTDSSASSSTSTDSSASSSSSSSDSQQSSSTATVMTSTTMQFDLFVKAFNGVKTNASSATIVKKNAYNYNNHVKAGMLSSVAEGLMGSLLKAEDVNETYTGDDIAANFPPAGATCGLTKSDIKSIDCKEEGDYYIITVVVKGAVNPSVGEKVGAVASIITKESIQEPISGVPGLNSIEPKCDYKATTAEAKIEKSTGNLVEYYFDLPMILYMDSYEIGLGFEEWWTVAY